MQHVYILSNPAFQHDIRKVGYTSVCVTERAKTLSSDTGVPLPFAVDFSLEVEHGYAVEQLAHNLLKATRINNNREFFKVTLSEAIDAVSRAASLMTAELAAKYEQQRVTRAAALSNGIKVEARPAEPKAVVIKRWKPTVVRDESRYDLDAPWQLPKSDPNYVPIDPATASEIVKALSEKQARRAREKPQREKAFKETIKARKEKQRLRNEYMKTPEGKAEAAEKAAAKKARKAAKKARNTAKAA